ncbi:NADH-FMN oxidoreductase RutF, flavin reductase (DIM6/NTAB) family [Arthrobacter cupressi]|uniref:NADH-FMN oxidoreductase RutF, flavin reductase (DIM6/NTAB) family n=1 Tax=Arthrobacter cupressi TaxID=1045773 RepID=A0A1G8VXK9_9MICC|nr:flavin reductase (DIM6/NTAB) family NADH-FMN oxidoreductase RutF [Arthrobacter cupressi]SDJ70821.1 NADH-FMN oxidoreductase RutF, flavin reductase (DIM6/NTAB) family [Arthrobacter cupressi]
MHAPEITDVDAQIDAIQHASAPSLPTDDFKAIFRGHPGGVTVISADAGYGPVALTASSVASVSAEPPLLVFSISALSSASDVLSRAATVIVHFLDVHDVDVAKLGATGGIDRFAQAQSWTRLGTGEPVFDNVRAWVRCAVVDRMQAGTSTIVVARALTSHIERDAQPGDPGDALVYHNRAWHRLGEHSRLEG